MAPEPDDPSAFDITEITAQTQPTTQPSTATTTSSNANPSKKKRKKRSPKPHILHQSTLRNPTWCYIHLRHLSSQMEDLPDLDPVTAHLHLTTALTQFLGLHGSAIAFDILKLESQGVWIRAQSEDQRAIVAAAGGWVSGKGEGWRVVGWSFWHAGVEGGRNGGQDLFNG